MPYAPSISRRPSASNQQGIFSSSLLSVGSSLKTVGNHAGRGLLKAVSAGYSHLTSEPTDRENVLYVKFSVLESKTTAGLQQQPVLLLGYENGFQVWDLQDCAQIQELVSRRDGAVRCAALALACTDSPFSLFMYIIHHVFNNHTCLQLFGALALATAATHTLKPFMQCLACTSHRPFTHSRFCNNFTQQHILQPLRAAVLIPKPLIPPFSQLQQQSAEPEMQSSPLSGSFGCSNTCL